MKVTVISIVIGAFGLSKVTGGIGNKNMSADHSKTILLRSPRILSKVLQETCCYSNSIGRPSVNAGVDDSQSSSSSSSMWLVPLAR